MKKFRSRYFLLEDDGVSDVTGAKSMGDMQTAEISLDQRIDALFTQYEKESLPGGQDPLTPGTTPTTSQPPGTVPEARVRSLKTLLMEIELANEMGGVAGVVGPMDGEGGDPGQGFPIEDSVPIRVRKVNKFKALRNEIDIDDDRVFGNSVPLRRKKDTVPTVKLILSRSLFEAEEPPPPPPDDAPPPDDMPPPPPDDDAPPGGDDAPPGGDEDTPDDVDAPDPDKPKINVNVFARSVARLVSSFRDLLDPERIILNRARAYITKNYDEQAGEQLMRVLDLQYNIRPMKAERSPPLSPNGKGSSPDSGSGLGGGGGD